MKRGRRLYKKKGYRKVYNDGPLRRVDLLQ
jgi:hypothetical protein